MVFYVDANTEGKRQFLSRCGQQVEMNVTEADVQRFWEYKPEGYLPVVLRDVGYTVFLGIGVTMFELRQLLAQDDVDPKEYWYVPIGELYRSSGVQFRNYCHQQGLYSPTRKD